MAKTYTIENSVGDSVTLLNLGARIVEWNTLVNDSTRNVILAYPDLDDYWQDDCYLGAIAGPYANRIANGEVKINDKTIRLSKNEGQNILHSGTNALDKCMWRIKEQSERAITFSYWLEDGFNGFPGAMVFEIEYRLAEDKSQLKINMIANSEKDTIIGPTGHAYFNLSQQQNTINKHQLQINAKQYTELSSDNIPTGSILPVTGTKLDFIKQKEINDCQLDDNYVVHDDDFVAKLVSPENDLTMTVKSDYPGVQVYTAEHLGAPLNKRQGICIEPQFYPDSPNHPNFPFSVTKANETFNKKIIYLLEK